MGFRPKLNDLLSCLFNTAHLYQHQGKSHALGSMSPYKLTIVLSGYGQHMRRNQAKIPECSGLTAELEETVVGPSLMRQVVVGLWDEKQCKDREGPGRENFSILLLQTLGLCFLPYWKQRKGLTLL